MAQDAVALTRELLRFETVNPPGRERDCANFIAGQLEEWGFSIQTHEFQEGRTSIVARLGGSEKKAPLCLTGHLDVVPLGSRAWTKNPFSGESDGDRLYGRGTSDMKAGIAAILLAVSNLKNHLKETPGIVLVFTAAEEGGCIGSQHLIRTQLLGKAGAMIVGEPTANYPYVGHKGSLKFHARFRGVSAHGSMPELGVNAIYRACHGISRLEKFEFDVKPHPVMGKPTLNVGTMEGGNTVNSVPDSAAFGVDIRTVQGMDHGKLLGVMREILGKETELDVFSDMPPVWTEPKQAWVQRVFEVAAKTLGEKPEPRAQTYNTDAGNLLQAYRGAPTVILGPGEPKQAHQTDEYVSMERIRQSVAIYEELIRDWCGA